MRQVTSALPAGSTASGAGGGRSTGAGPRGNSCSTHHARAVAFKFEGRRPTPAGLHRLVAAVAAAVVHGSGHRVRRGPHVPAGPGTGGRRVGTQPTSEPPNSTMAARSMAARWRGECGWVGGCHVRVWAVAAVVVVVCVGGGTFRLPPLPPVVWQPRCLRWPPPRSSRHRPPRRAAPGGRNCWVRCLPACSQPGGRSCSLGRARARAGRNWTRALHNLGPRSVRIGRPE